MHLTSGAKLMIKYVYETLKCRDLVTTTAIKKKHQLLLRQTSSVQDNVLKLIGNRKRSDGNINKRVDEFGLLWISHALLY